MGTATRYLSIGMVLGAISAFACDYLTENDNRQVYVMTDATQNTKVRILARYEGEDAFWVERCDGGVPFALNRGEFAPTNDGCE